MTLASGLQRMELRTEGCSTSHDALNRYRLFDRTMDDFVRAIAVPSE